MSIGPQNELPSALKSTLLAGERNDVADTPYSFSAALLSNVSELARRVQGLREGKAFTSETLAKIAKYFRIKNIYNSNAIEGNQLNIGETRLVVEQGMTISGRSLKDQAEAKNLSAATDFMEILAATRDQPITETDIRQIHSLILREIDNANAGRYRMVQVQISGSAFPTPAPETVAAQMQEFSRWLGPISTPGEKYASVDGLIYAAVAHAWFVYIHPFVDGNGRLSRVLMNLILMRYGFPISIISKDDRKRYYDALEISQSGDLTDFLALLIDCACESVDEYEAAVKDQRDEEEWSRRLVDRLTKPQQVQARNEYELWSSAMELLKKYFGRVVSMIHTQASARGVSVYLKSFDPLEFEKYESLRNGRTTKRTWFFRIDFRTERKSARYLFFFGMPATAFKGKFDVTVHVAREQTPYHFERLEFLPSEGVPNLFEIGYSPDEELFVARRRGGRLDKSKIEKIGELFMEEVVSLHFSSL